MAADGKREKKRGPKGGIKHQPGRGHDTKSKPRKSKRFRELAARNREERERIAREEWARWDNLPEQTKKLLGKEGQPKYPRPKNGP